MNIQPDSSRSPAAEKTSEQKNQKNEEFRKGWISRMIEVAAHDDIPNSLKSEIQPQEQIKRLTQRSAENVESMNKAENILNTMKGLDPETVQRSEIKQVQVLIDDIAMRFFEEAMYHNSVEHIASSEQNINELFNRHQALGGSPQDCEQIKKQAFVKALQNYRELVGENDFVKKMEALSIEEAEFLRTLLK